MAVFKLSCALKNIWNARKKVVFIIVPEGGVRRKWGFMGLLQKSKAARVGTRLFGSWGAVSPVALSSVTAPPVKYFLSVCIMS